MDGVNHYAYCSANPIKYSDPTGLFTVDWTASGPGYWGDIKDDGKNGTDIYEAAYGRTDPGDGSTIGVNNTSNYYAEAKVAQAQGGKGAVGGTGFNKDSDNKPIYTVADGYRSDAPKSYGIGEDVELEKETQKKDSFWNGVGKSVISDYMTILNLTPYGLSLSAINASKNTYDLIKGINDIGFKNYFGGKINDIKDYFNNYPKEIAGIVSFRITQSILGGLSVKYGVEPFAKGGNSWHFGLERPNNMNVVHVGKHPNFGVHIAFGSVKSFVANVHIYFKTNFPFFRIWKP